MTNVPSPLGIWRKIAYASGQAGTVMVLQLIGTFVLPLYTPPTGQGYPMLVPAFAGAVAMMMPRLVDTFFDPWLANRSDTSRTPLGRRRAFMLFGFIPLALATAAVFRPPFEAGSMANAVFLTVAMTAHFCLFSVYVAPYLALLPELFPDKVTNTQVSTMQAFAALLGGMAVTVIAPSFLPQHDDGRAALKIMATVLCGIALVLFALPVIFVDERRYVHRAPGVAASHLGPMASLLATFKERAFIPYVAGSTFFWIGFTAVQTAAPNFVEVLLKKSLNDMIMVLGPLFGVAGVFFLAIGPLQRRFGKRKLMVFSSLLLAPLMGVGIPLLPSMPGLALPLFGVAGISISLFLALPNAILADVCEANAKKTGERREGMFFGAQGFLQKASVAFAAAMVSVLAETFGKSFDNPLGVQLSGPFAAVALVIAAVCFWLYPEARVQAEAAADAAAAPSS